MSSEHETPGMHCLRDAPTAQGNAQIDILWLVYAVQIPRLWVWLICAGVVPHFLVCTLFFPLGCQIILRREKKQVELSSSLPIRNTSEKLVEGIKPVLPLQLFGHLIQKNLVCSFPLLFVLISLSCLMDNFNHNSAWVLSWNSKPLGSQTQKYQSQGQMSPLKTNMNVIPGRNVTFSLLYRTDSAYHSLISIQKNPVKFQGPVKKLFQQTLETPLEWNFFSQLRFRF